MGGFFLACWPVIYLAGWPGETEGRFETTEKVYILLIKAPETRLASLPFFRKGYFFSSFGRFFRFISLAK